MEIALGGKDPEAPLRPLAGVSDVSLQQIVSLKNFSIMREFSPQGREKKNVWGIVLKVIMAALSALAGAVGMTACMR